MPDPPPGVQSKTEKLVQSSFVLGVASIACGVTALPAIIQSVRALASMRREAARRSDRRKVIFSLLFSSCVLAFVLFTVIAAVTAAQAIADRINCISCMKQLAIGIRLYEIDHYGRFPPTNWCDVLLTNGIATSGFQTGTSNCFHCPDTPRRQKCGYAVNQKLIRTRDIDQIAPDTVMLFESDAGWNAVGGPEIMARGRHRSGLNIAFADGSVAQLRIDDIPNLRWNPDTNSPAK
jgi:prepilin-type processing-associated H-X9-DG protein